MSLAEKIKYSYADYIKWDGKTRYELIDGAAYAMASPSQEHQEISGEFFRQLANFLRGKPCKVFHAPFDVRLNYDSYDDTVVQPDILIVCDKSKLNGRSVKGAPDMIIEIMSSNTRHDTFVKFRLYQKAGVREYWIVDPKTRTVQVYLLDGGKYTINYYTAEDTAPVHILENCEINLADVFNDTIESLESYDDISKQILIEAMKTAGISDEKIEEVIRNAELN
ncbi:MAG: Uma2 family endonuclease [Oscillospiraceae bacterium]|nr:Uma2 family endonuclease [Oscillospiraceae bacterium]